MKLKNCPFCGRKPKLLNKLIWCERCNLDMELDSKEQTIINWNSRYESIKSDTVKELRRDNKKLKTLIGKLSVNL